MAYVYKEHGEINATKFNATMEEDSSGKEISLKSITRPPSFTNYTL